MLKIVIWQNMTAAAQKNCLLRPAQGNADLIKNQVAAIIATVKNQRDKALYSYTKSFDRIELSTLRVPISKIVAAKTRISKQNLEAINFAFEQIRRFHFEQFQSQKKLAIRSGVTSLVAIRAIQRVGLYVPGGEAPLPSTVLMLGIPSLIAGCENRIICTPPNDTGAVDDNILYAANLCGIDEIYTVGGAQAVAAMAYGTESISKVNKIFGPGNVWVTHAKMAVMADPSGASCDLPAGPSELVVIADQYADGRFVAADLLAQAEHGCDAQVILITTCVQLAEQVIQEIKRQIKKLSRNGKVVRALESGKIILVDKIQTAFDICNDYAPEHLSLQINKPNKWLSAIQNAGAVFVGKWTAQTLGDYVIGNNHVLPTYGYSKVQSGLRVSDFTKSINMQMVTKRGCKNIAPFAVNLAQLEQLDAHANAVSVRLEAML